jgi:hypothetical protein
MMTAGEKAMTKKELRQKYLQGMKSPDAAKILELAFGHDDYHNRRFSPAEFELFCNGDAPTGKSEDIHEAWTSYRAYHNELANYNPIPPQAA